MGVGKVLNGGNTSQANNQMNSGMALLYPAPCIIMAIPPLNGSPLSLRSRGRPCRFPGVHGSPVPVEDERAAHDSSSDSHGSRYDGGGRAFHGEWRTGLDAGGGAACSKHVMSVCWKQGNRERTACGSRPWRRRFQEGSSSPEKAHLAVRDEEERHCPSQHDADNGRCHCHRICRDIRQWYGERASLSNQTPEQEALRIISSESSPQKQKEL